MTLKKYHLTKKWENYSLKKEWAKRASKIFTWNKQNAIKKSAEILKKDWWASLRIHKNSWPIQEERTYPRSKDPISSKG